MYPTLNNNRKPYLLCWFLCAPSSAAAAFVFARSNSAPLLLLLLLPPSVALAGSGPTEIIRHFAMIEAVLEGVISLPKQQRPKATHCRRQHTTRALSQGEVRASIVSIRELSIPISIVQISSLSGLSLFLCHGAILLF